MWHEMAHILDAQGSAETGSCLGKLVSERGDETVANSMTKNCKRPGGAETSSGVETAQGQQLGQV